MKAITIWQPWAEFIAAGVKHNETRSWAKNTENLLRSMQQSSQYAKSYRFCQKKPSGSWLRSWKKQAWQTVSS